MSSPSRTGAFAKALPMPWHRFAVPPINFELVLRRTLAGCADWLIASITLALLSSLASAFVGFDRHDVVMRHVSVELVYLAYFVIGWRRGHTPGMYLCSIRMTNLEGRTAGWIQLAKTYAVFTLYFLWISRTGWLLNVSGWMSDPGVSDDQAREMLRWIATNGKEVMYALIFVPVFFTGGERSLANLFGETKIIPALKTV